jgi:predicted alpha-1,2-mannosidase
MVSDFEDCGYLPRWSSLGEVGCMPSTLVDGIIANAVATGIGDKELHQRLLDAMLHHATVECKDKRYGRNGLEAYLKFGYVPCDFEKESVNLTLDFSYGDWCIAQVAKSLGRVDIASEYEKRAQYYKSLFDPSVGYFRGKDSNGNFVGEFDPSRWGGYFTESGAYQCLFGAPHALDEIAKMLGGKEKALARLDEFLSTKPKFRVQGYGGEIHEMSEMALSDLGQCAISNQPSFSMPYLFAYFGSTEKTNSLVRKICKEYFTINSYPGDEDTGSMSAWYIFATLGKFPICPGKKEYVEFNAL